MSFDFGSLSGAASDPFHVVLIDRVSGKPLVGTDGKEAYIDVLSAQSDVGRKFDRERSQASQRRAMVGLNTEDDALAENIEKLARLTVAWNLVDPVSKEPLGVPVSVDAAKAFYALPGAFHFYIQAWVGANEPTNFIKRSPTNS